VHPPMMALDHNKVGLVHFMAYPGPGATKSVQRGEARERYLLASLEEVAKDPYFGSIEITRIKNPQIRRKAVELLLEHDMEIIFSAQPIQLYNEDGLIAKTDISSIDEVLRQQAVERILSYIDEAYDMHAIKFGLISGTDPGTESGLRLRQRAIEALIRSLDEICAYATARAKELGREPLSIALELFDRLDGRNCKNQLIGPSEDALVVAERVRDIYGHKNFGLLYDLSHMPMIKNMSFEPETAETVKTLGKYLVHVHIGTCVMDSEDPLYGDTHPGFDYPGSAVTEEMLAEFVKALHEIGYTGRVGFEFQPAGSQLSKSLVDVAKSWYDKARSRIDVNYALGTYYFQTRRYFTEAVFQGVTDARLTRPAIIEEAAKARERRKTLLQNGKLLILAADHPARNVTGVGDEPVRMGDRMDYLGRVARVMGTELIDGIMATTDIIEDLLILDYLRKEKGLSGFLDGKLLIGSMNRSGLAGIEYEMDDRMTCFTPERMRELNMDGAKILFRLETGRYSRYSVQTMDYCAKAIAQCRALNLPVFVEPLPVEKQGDGYRVIADADALIKMIGIASALGDSSRDLWLKIPYVPEFYRVTQASTLPMLMLGGPSSGDPTGMMQNFERGMGEGNNVFGAMVGRNVLYPGKDDPRAVANAVYRICHDELRTEEAIAYLQNERGQDLDELSQLFE
jgi:DhnA family fructose-bisphosphate aldolase class Ia/sugar phosphate isomerase/epimerase